MMFFKRLFGGVCYGCGKMAYSEECCQTITGKTKTEIATLKDKVEKLEKAIEDINNREIRRINAESALTRIPVQIIKPYSVSG